MQKPLLQEIEPIEVYSFLALFKILGLKIRIFGELFYDKRFNFLDNYGL
ncbi:hypothetical protein BPO_2393 [Bergeyella porcorum]|uniref:Uncharacterized protein n=1 Tax=Bergeyella porcorum TaxID=1735111 RepID=A0AAU0F573_9FLAO